MARFEEIMSGREIGDDEPPESFGGSDSAEDTPPVDEAETRHAARPKGRRMRRFEEIMSGRPIPDPEADSAGESTESEQ